MRARRLRMDGGDEGRRKIGGDLQWNRKPVALIVQSFEIGSGPAEKPGPYFCSTGQPFAWSLHHPDGMVRPIIMPETWPPLLPLTPLSQ